MMPGLPRVADTAFSEPLGHEDPVRTRRIAFDLAKARSAIVFIETLCLERGCGQGCRTASPPPTFGFARFKEWLPMPEPRNSGGRSNIPIVSRSAEYGR